MPKEPIKVMVEGGKATPAPPLGPSLSSLKVNVGQVVDDINQKTKDMAGMQVPVTVTVDTKTKEYGIEVGTPPSADLIKKEAGIKKGSGNPKADMVAELKIEQIIKIAKIKEAALSGKTLKEKVKEIVGTCNSLGIMVEGKKATETIKDINSGKYDREIKEEKTEISAAELKELEEEKKRLAAEIEERRQEFEEKAKEIISSMEGKERWEIKGKLTEAEIPTEIIEELLPAEAAAPAEEKKEEEKKE
jgi:large subunit ribosomal protein L11